MTDSLHDFFNESSWEHVSGDMINPNEPERRKPRNRREARKQRMQKRRNNTTKMIIVVLSAILLLSGIAALISFKHKTDSKKAAVSGGDYSAVEAASGVETDFTVKIGESGSEVAERLLSADIIKSVDAFTRALVSANATSSLLPGTYKLKTHMPAADVVAILTDSDASNSLEVRQGETVTAVIDRAVKATSIPRENFESIINSGGKNILPAEAGGKFEGWLQPGTYDATGDSITAEGILKEMVSRRIAALDALNVPTGAQRQRILNIASIVEAEVNKQDYYGKVSRVIQNRLEQGIPLGCDSAVAYGLGINGTELTNAQLADASNPYNTRVLKGLPPTPIDNAGGNAIKAAMDPETGSWLYFVTVNSATGETKFTDDYDQFLAWCEEMK